MSKLTKYKHYTSQYTEFHTIIGTNCNTTHIVPKFLSPTLVHALMGFVFGKNFLTDEPDKVKSKAHIDNLKNAFMLQSLGVVFIEGTTVKLRKEYLSLVKRLKNEGWYYWFGHPANELEFYLKQNNRLI